MENIELYRYDKPTPVQKFAMEASLGGRDLMACAQTEVQADGRNVMAPSPMQQQGGPPPLANYVGCGRGMPMPGGPPPYMMQPRMDDGGYGHALVQQDPNYRGSFRGHGPPGGHYRGQDQGQPRHAARPPIYTGRQSYDNRNMNSWGNQPPPPPYCGGTPQIMSAGQDWNCRQAGGLIAEENHVPDRWRRMQEGLQTMPDREAGGREQPIWNNQLPRNQTVEDELFSSSSTGINFDKYEDILVEATGQNEPQCIQKFVDLELHPRVMKNIELRRYDKPTPVQKFAIRASLGGRDLMACAQTGSGKKAAFLLPIINAVLCGGPSRIKPTETLPNGEPRQYPLALVLAPTRELSLQIFNESRNFAYGTPIQSAILYGGRENYHDQINKLRLGGCHILVATPDRLIDVMKQGYIGLAGCRFLVLDEVDRMLDMGFEPQIRQLVDMSGMPDRNTRQTMMFSATLPKEIQHLAQHFLVPDYVFLAVDRVGSTSENDTQNVVWVEEPDKREFLMDLLNAGPTDLLTLVFVETKRGAADLANYLNRQNYQVVAIHGDLEQFEREQNLDSFRTGRTPILVATSGRAVARGLDIPNVEHVINFDLPGDIDEYVHRIGRVGNVGSATSFFNDKNRNIARDLAMLAVESNQELPDWLERMAREGRAGDGGMRGRGCGGRFGGAGFGGRDYRDQYQRGGGHGGASGFSQPPRSNGPPMSSSSKPSQDWWNN